MRRMRSLAISLAFGLLSLATQARTCPADLRIAFLDKALPPMLMGEGSRFEDPPGRFVDWTRTALDALGCSAELVRVPQRRLLSDTANDSNQVTLYFGYTPDRAQALVYPLLQNGQPDPGLALSETHLALFVRADRAQDVQWDGRHLLPASLVVGAVGGGVEEPIARAAGWKLDMTLSHSASVAMLRRGRIDLALLPAMSFTPERLNEAPALVELKPGLQRIFFFAPVSPGLQARDPQFVRRFWVELCKAARDRPARPHDKNAPSCKPQ